jgi:hypothetical protein
MRLTLKLHPDSRCAAVTRIEVDVVRLHAGALRLLYRIICNMSDLRMPTAAVATRADGLWHHTCFEAFIRGPQSPAYYELNFSPSTQWAAYRFSEYRGEMTIAHEIGAPHTQVHANGACFELQTALNLNRSAILPSNATWHLGISAVVEERNDRLSYWALAHPPGKADFHHSDCFAHELPATVRS